MLKPSFILGYDPGGNDKHGVAVLEVAPEKQRWRATSLPLLTECQTVHQVIDLVEKTLRDCALIACGIDTLTAWSSSESGWRPADKLLRTCYHRAKNSVDNPNHINGSMSLNGALVLHWLSQRADKGGMITEAHPKVCYYAIRNVRHPWWRADKNRAYGRKARSAQRSAKAWLLSQLGVSSQDVVPAGVRLEFVWREKHEASCDCSRRGIWGV